MTLIWNGSLIYHLIIFSYLSISQNRQRQLCCDIFSIFQLSIHMLIKSVTCCTKASFSLLLILLESGDIGEDSEAHPCGEGEVWREAFEDTGLYAFWLVDEEQITKIYSKLYNRPRQNSPPYFLLAVTSSIMTPGIKARGVLKNSGNYLSDEHRVFPIWSRQYWDNCI